MGTWTKDCGDGCLINVKEDPTEHEDLASDPAYATVLKTMQDTLKELNKDLFKPNRGTDRLEACQVALSQGRVLGPFVDANDFYSRPPARTRYERASDSILDASLKVLNNDFVKSSIVAAANSVCPKYLSHVHWDTCIYPDLASRDELTERDVGAFVTV